MEPKRFEGNRGGGEGEAFHKMCKERTYRELASGGDLINFVVIVKETDLFIKADSDLSAQAKEAILKYRKQLEDYIALNPIFRKTLKPYKVEETAPPIAKEMGWAGSLARVGPMAAVAGAIAEYVGKELLKFSRQVIVENGGDLFLKSEAEMKIAIYAGKSPFSNRLAIKLSPEKTPMGICTSSGTVGHSLSLGKADAVVITSKSTSLADAVATAVGNIIKSPEDIPRGLEFAQNITGVEGAIIIKDDELGVWGDIQLAKV